MLRSVRIGISLLVVLLFGLIFLGGEQASTFLAKPLSYVQFTPALAQWTLSAGGAAALGVLCILLLTLGFGRVYCACLCPLGIFQDGLLFLAGTLRRKTVYALQPAYPFLRYGMLATTIASFVLGSLALPNFLDPYSFAGRLMSQLFRPIVVFLNNLLAALLEVFGVYALASLPIPPLLWLPFSVTLLGFLLLAGMTIRRGRLYCNTLCPVGAILGMVSRFAFYKIALQQAECINCGLCAQKCRAGCIDVPHKTIDASRCVACFDCLAICPKTALAYRRRMPQTKPEPIDPARRKLLALTASAAGTLMVASLPLRSAFRPLLPAAAVAPVVPPGALSVAHFTATCTACYLCVNICPAQGIQPALFAYGLRGVLQPTLDYKHGYCAYECNACGRVCPTGAITPLPLAEKKLTQIGQTKLIKDLCVVYAKKQECGACVEVCPTHAVYTEERETILYPETKVEHCTGCGRCELVCPVVPAKAIFVEARAVHASASEPYYVSPPARQAAPPSGSSDFPF